MSPAIRRKRPDEDAQLFDIWLRSVQATHAFVSAQDTEAFQPLVRDYLASAAEFWVVDDERERPAGFMGMTGNKMDALFLAPEHQGRGYGRALVDHARAIHGELTVDVNEQNDAARRFYEHCGFEVEGRSALDGSGRPYPLLHMRLRGC